MMWHHLGELGIFNRAFLTNTIWQDHQYLSRTNNAKSSSTSFAPLILTFGRDSKSNWLMPCLNILQGDSVIGARTKGPIQKTDLSKRWVAWHLLNQQCEMHRQNSSPKTTQICVSSWMTRIDPFKFNHLPWSPSLKQQVCTWNWMRGICFVSCWGNMGLFARANLLLVSGELAIWKNPSKSTHVKVVKKTSGTTPVLWYFWKCNNKPFESFQHFHPKT